MNDATTLLKNYRAKNPRSRAVRLVRYVVNTANTKQEQCILCGEIGPSWCARYPQTKRAAAWRENHVAKHLAS